MSSLAVRALLVLVLFVASLGSLSLGGCASRGAAPELGGASSLESPPSREVGAGASDAGDIPTGPSDSGGASTAAGPRSPALRAAVAWAPTVVLGSEGRRVCSGRAPKEAPHTAACCYPAREALLAPIRAIHGALRACYDGLPAPRLETRVGVKFHVGQDGRVDEACAEEANDVPAALTTCVVEAFREARYPAMSADETKRCGLLSVSYPVQFSP